MKNDLISKFPEIAKEWHPSMNYDADKNIDLKPGNFSYGSKVKIWWQCSKGHEWQASIVNRTHGGTGCPYCAGRHGIAVSDKSNKLNLIRHILENTNFSQVDIAKKTGASTNLLTKMESQRQTAVLRGAVHDEPEKTCMCEYKIAD